MKTLYIRYDKTDRELTAAYGLLCRHAGLYTVLQTEDAADHRVELSFDPALDGEGYEIRIGNDGVIRLSGGAFAGLCYGIGRILHRSPELLQSEKRAPEKTVRGVYFATHFYNYYQAAPIEKIQEYIEELFLWGCNGIAVWFDRHAFSGFSDEEAGRMIERLHRIFEAAKACRMKTTLGMLANEHFYGAPKEYLAENSTNGTGYRRPLCGFYHTELCPSKPEARRLLLDTHRAVIERFADVGLDNVWLWPYDQGGCTCESCRPWGPRGFLDLSAELGGMIKSVSPQTKLTLSTWRFDSFTDGEWEGFLDRFDMVRENFDQLLLDLGSSAIPEELYEKCGQAEIPLWGFPEISMLSAVPWGGFGAVPVPVSLCESYRRTAVRHDGGMLYSEGIFEDLNKAVMLSLYFGETDLSAVVGDYCRCYFGDETVSDMRRLIFLLEGTLPRHRRDENGVFDDYPRADRVSVLPQFILKFPKKCGEALALAEKLREALPSRIAESGRFRLLYLRAVIDAELSSHGGNLTETIEEAAKELVRISFAERADYAVSPITRDVIYTNRGHI